MKRPASRPIQLPRLPRALTTGEHRAAFDRLIAAGAGPGFARDLLPPLPHDLPLIAAYGFMAPLTEGYWEGWTKVPLGEVDPRVHYKQAELVGLSRSAPGLGVIVIGDVVNDRPGWPARLLHRRQGGGYTEHRPVGLDGRPIRFNSRNEACNCLNHVVDSIWGWRWKPRIREGSLDGGWTFHPGDEIWPCDDVRARWTGKRGVWTAMVSMSGGVTLFHGGSELRDHSGQLLDAYSKQMQFPDMVAARHHAEGQDKV
jgi:hypothetical protein